MTKPQELWTIGYKQWPPATRWQRLVASMLAAEINVLVDIRHSPCSSQLAAESNYGPRQWNLQTDGGIQAGLKAVGIDYRWLVQLGNPQKNDPNMAVLKSHLADEDGNWPVHDGLNILKELLASGKRCCLLCACHKYEKCHRRLVVESLGGTVVHRPVRM